MRRLQHQRWLQWREPPVSSHPCVAACPSCSLGQHVSKKVDKSHSNSSRPRCHRWIAPGTYGSRREPPLPVPILTRRCGPPIDAICGDAAMRRCGDASCFLYRSMGLLQSLAVKRRTPFTPTCGNVARHLQIRPLVLCAAIDDVHSTKSLQSLSSRFRSHWRSSLRGHEGKPISCHNTLG